jgi:curved DNA-binding protein CbpA
MLPPDDLYARLELPVDASFEAVEIAWRALLKRHHPDVAGAAADDTAKRINVAHDWLSDPAMRQRYDRERHPRRQGSAPPPMAGHQPRRPIVRRSTPRRPLDPAHAVEEHLARIRRLNEDELDRLSLAEAPPIAFVASISRFLSADQLAAVEGLETRVQDALPRRSRWDVPTRDAAIGYAHELLLRPFLDEHLSEPFRERVQERLARGWQAAVGQPRYGPNTDTVVAGLERLRATPQVDLGRPVAEAAAAGTLPVDLPWPRGLTPQDDDALRVSSALAQRDALAILGDPVPALARRSLARAMHGLVLKHGFRPAELDRMLGPWRAILLGRPEAVRPRPRDGAAYAPRGRGR